jgi:hypothetical protein
MAQAAQRHRSPTQPHSCRDLSQTSVSYYWSTYQHEWALDVVFHHVADLRRFYPRWVNHAMTTFSSPDVMRLLGKHTTLSGQLHQNFSGEVVSDFKRRAEGVRVTHSVNGNSVKLYDKAYTPKGSVLRAQATFHNGDDSAFTAQGGRPQRAPCLASTAPGHR